MDTAAPLTIASIEQIHQMLGRPPPPHPLLSVIAASWQAPAHVTVPIIGRSIVSLVYAVSLKRGDECALELGRQLYDGQAGSLVFLAPDQTVTPLEGGGELTPSGDGWTLVFHPDLLRDGPLAARMREYGFFGYAAREALHLAEDEREILTGLVHRLEEEASRAPDPFSGDVLTAELLVLLTYCQRFYARQFQTRVRAHGGVVARLERHLDEYLASARPAQEGLPTVRSCAGSLGYSADYLSDLLREETGESARVHIHRALIETAKARLRSSTANVSEIAYALGFEHPQHFAKLFKQKTGKSPGAWRG